jgi:hypothetical protein
MDSRDLPAGCGFCALWVTATTCGLIVGNLVNHPIVEFVGGPTYWAGNLAFLYWALLTVLTGTVISLAQGLVFRGRAPLLWWVAAGALGWSLGEIAEQLTIVGVAGRLGTWPTGVSLAWHWAVKWTVTGLSAGVIQWLILRRNYLTAGWWVLASTVGWTGGGLALEFISGEFSFGIEFVVGGLIAGSVTGAFFVVARMRRGAGPATIRSRD